MIPSEHCVTLKIEGIRQRGRPNKTWPGGMY